MSNIDTFNRGVALILDQAFERFPHSIYIETEELEPDVSPEQADIYASTFEFLIREGFMHGRRVADNANLYEGVLTTKGLAVLNSVPDSIKEKTPLRERISASLKSGTREAVNAVIGQVISASMRGMLPGA